MIVFTSTSNLRWRSIVLLLCGCLYTAPGLQAQNLAPLRLDVQVAPPPACTISTTVSATSDTSTPIPACISLVIDRSTSMVIGSLSNPFCSDSQWNNQGDCEDDGAIWVNTRMKAAQNAATQLVNRLDAANGDHVGLVSFASTESLDQSVTSNFASVISAIDGINAFGLTNVADATRRAAQDLGNCPAGTAANLVVIADGVANRYRPNWPSGSVSTCSLSPTSTTDCTDAAIEAGQDATAAGIQVYTVGLDLDANDPTQNVGLNMLQDMATGADAFYNATSNNIADVLVSDIRSRAGNTVVSGASFEETLPNCWQYVGGSTTGSTMNDPTCSGTPTDGNPQTCTWALGGFASNETKSISYSMEYLPECAPPAASVTLENGRVNYQNTSGLQAAFIPNSNPLELAVCQALLPVELVSFEAVLDGRFATLTWETASETNNAGFEVQRRDADALEAVEPDTPTTAWEVLGFVEGHGTTLTPQAYRYGIADLEPGRHVFRLKQVDYDGAFEYSPQVEVSVGLPESYLLTPAYPNPFNPQTQLSLSVKRSQQVTVSAYDMLGRKVAELFRGEMGAGQSRALVFEADSLPNGLYVIRAEGTYFVATRTVTLLK